MHHHDYSKPLEVDVSAFVKKGLKPKILAVTALVPAPIVDVSAFVKKGLKQLGPVS
jgi:hypothetical protein